MPKPKFLDPQYTAAVVFGAHDWTEAGMSRAPSFLRSAKGVLAYLIDSAGLGLDPTLVLDLFDDTTSASEQLTRVRDTFDLLLRERRQEGRPVTDLLIYYVGHGYTDDQGHLSLLVRRSKQGMEAESGIKAPDLARVLKRAAPQQRRIVILDCCFSEAAAKDFIGQSSALDQAVAATATKALADDAPQRGSLLLCSSPLGEISIGAPNAERTLFTGAVLEVLRSGIADKPHRLSIADLRDAAYELMLGYFGANAPMPVLHQPNAKLGDLTRIPAFPNRAVLQVLNSPHSSRADSAAMTPVGRKESALPDSSGSAKHSPPQRPSIQKDADDLHKAEDETVLNINFEALLLDVLTSFVKEKKYEMSNGVFLPPIPDGVAAEARQCFSLNSRDNILCVIKANTASFKDLIVFGGDAIYFRDRPAFKEHKYVLTYPQLTEGQARLAWSGAIYLAPKGVLLPRWQWLS